MILPACLVTMLALAGCRFDGENSTAPIETQPAISKFIGVWQSPAYAETVEIDESLNVFTYRHTEEVCWLDEHLKSVDEDVLSRLLQLNDTFNSLELIDGFGTVDFHAPGNVFTRSPNLPSQCLPNNIVETNEVELNSLDIFNLVVQIYEQYYVDFSLHDVDWSAHASVIKATLNKDSSTEDLQAALEFLLTPLRDGHNAVTIGDDEIRVFNKELYSMVFLREFSSSNGLKWPIEKGEWTPSIQTQWENYFEEHSELLRENIVELKSNSIEIKQINDGLIWWFVEGSIGYLNIAAMTGYSDAPQDSLDIINRTMQQVIQDNQNSDALIIDIRTNPGGDDFISLAVARYFADSYTHAYSKQARLGDGFTELIPVYIDPADSGTFTRPIYLLTSNSTVSAAEVFALSMSEFDHVKIVGEPSQGAFSDALEWQIGDDLTIELSNERYLSAEDDWYEGVGVPVDISVRFPNQQDRQNGIEPAIQAVISDLGL
jgi:hypothetical protein